MFLGWSIFGYHNTCFLVIFRLSKLGWHSQDKNDAFYCCKTSLYNQQCPFLPLLLSCKIKKRLVLFSGFRKNFQLRNYPSNHLFCSCYRAFHVVWEPSEIHSCNTGYHDQSERSVLTVDVDAKLPCKENLLLIFWWSDCSLTSQQPGEKRDPKQQPNRASPQMSICTLYQ